MFHYRRRRYRKNEEEIRSLIPLSNPVPISSNLSSREFISAVMALRYRPKISLEDLATAEREFIGEGQSFRVEKAFVDSSDSSPQVVALKHPLFSDGSTNDSTHWNRLWLEVRSLMHPPLAAHPNIIDLLAIGWQRGLSNTNPELEWPVLVMPHATNGTLDAFQWSPVLGEKEKVSMCLDVALGLKALHGCGVVHGDLKSENVLVFAEKGGPVARLCDFGCSIIGPQALGNLAGGSQPWNCPEWKDTLSKENFPFTDVYSFGLLVWRTLSTNRRPYQALQYFVENSLLSEDDIDRLKRLPNDRFLEEVKESIKSICAESEEKGLFEQVLHHTIRFNPRQRSLDQAVGKLEELLKLKNGGNMPYVLTRTVMKLLRQASHTSRGESGSRGSSRIDSAPLEIDVRHL
jgi:serine/threonine protein kinase